MSSELELATEDVYCRSVEDAAQRMVGGQSLPPSHAKAEARNSPGPQLLSHEDMSEPQSFPVREDRPHKFHRGPDSTMITANKTSLGTEGAQPGITAPKLNSLDQELRKSEVKDVLGNYLDDKAQSAVKELIHTNPGLSRNEPTEAMDVDTRPLPEPVIDTQDEPMETEQSEPSPGTFQPELGMPRYTQSLVHALLDTDPDVLGLAQSKAPGAGQLEGSPKSKMTLQKRKQP